MRMHQNLAKRYPCNMPDLHTDINIRETINSGQIFLWENYRDAWFVIDGCDIIMVKQTPFEIITFSKEPKDFFREGDNYQKILKNITKDKIVKRTSKHYPGLRVTRQDPFQCCISFIVSANFVQEFSSPCTVKTLGSPLMFFITSKSAVLSP